MGCCVTRDDPGSPRDTQFVSQSRVPGILDYASQGLVTIPPIPTSVQVSTLLLQNNFLTTLPSTLTLPTLTELDLSGNRLVRVPDCLKRFPALETLNISNNPLSRTGGYEELPNIPNLRSLRMGMCSVRRLPAAMTRCARLASLDISFNHFVDLSGSEISTMPALTELNVSNCTLREVVPAGITNSTSLRKLNISYNSLDITAAHAFGSTLESNLEALFCNATGITTVPLSIVNLQGLKELHVAKNKNVSFSSLIGRSMKLETVNLSECELTNLPDGLEVAAPTLTALDIAFNENIDIGQLATHLPNLRKISVLGCRFAIKGDGRDQEWFELAKLRQLEDIEWSVWGESRRYTGGFACNPYSTRFPLQLCALKLVRMNGATVRPGLFTGDRLETLQNILRDGYYKVDFLFEASAVTAHHQIVSVLQSITTALHETVSSNETFENVVRQRYCFFLFLQALHPESVLLPPLDIVAVHYAHMCCDPNGYKRLCDRVFNSIVDNNYRLVLLEDLENNDFSRYATFWDAEVRHLEETRNVKLRWLRYGVLLGLSIGDNELTPKVSPRDATLSPAPSSHTPNSNNSSSSNAPTKGGTKEAIAMRRIIPSGRKSPPPAPEPPAGGGGNPLAGSNAADGAAIASASSPKGRPLPKVDFNRLNLGDGGSAVLDVFGLLDPNTKRQVRVDIAGLLGSFQQYCRGVATHRDLLETMGSEAWLRYAKYLTLLALPDVLPPPSPMSPLGAAPPPGTTSGADAAVAAGGATGFTASNAVDGSTVAAKSTLEMTPESSVASTASHPGGGTVTLPAMLPRPSVDAQRAQQQDASQQQQQQQQQQLTSSSSTLAQSDLPPPLRPIGSGPAPTSSSQAAPETSLAATSASGSNKGSSVMTRRSSLSMRTAAAPTFAIKDALYLHRAAPVKYNLMLDFLGIPTDTVEGAGATPRAILMTYERWSAVFGEPYIKAVHSVVWGNAAAGAPTSGAGGTGVVGQDDAGATKGGDGDDASLESTVASVPLFSPSGVETDAQVAQLLQQQSSSQLSRSNDGKKKNRRVVITAVDVLPTVTNGM